MTNKIIPSVDQNYWLKSLILVTNQLIKIISKVSKFSSKRIRERGYKTLGTYVIYSPLNFCKKKKIALQLFVN